MRMYCYAQNSILLQSVINYVPRMDIPKLINNVQLNCHISDARHAGNYTLCVYLLKMREFYRWQHQFSFSEKLSADDVGNWLSEHEALWDSLQNEDYHQLQIASTEHDPFDSQTINQKLFTQNLVYSGGYGIKGKPHFFLADLEKKQNINNYTIYICGKEYARDLTSPPAMSQHKTIYINHLYSPRIF